MNGGRVDDYEDNDVALSLYGVDSVSMIRLIEQLNPLCKEPGVLDTYVDDNTTIAGLAEIILN